MSEIVIYLVENSSLLLRTGNAMWRVKAKNIYRASIKTSCKVKVMNKKIKYIREPLSVKFPETSVLK